MLHDEADFITKSDNEIEDHPHLFTELFDEDDRDEDDIARDYFSEVYDDEVDNY